jgi:hypothetical protein
MMREKQKEKSQSTNRTRKLLEKERVKRPTNVYKNYEGRKKRQRNKIITFYEAEHIL